MKLARIINSDDKIIVMRCTIFACERPIELMCNYFNPRISDQELWSRLQIEAFKRRVEWIETRLIASGPKTKIWYQESSSRPMQAGELMSFDYDIVGSYGYYTDMSRTWLCCDEKPSKE